MTCAESSAVGTYGRRNFERYLEARIISRECVSDDDRFGCVRAWRSSRRHGCALGSLGV